MITQVPSSYANAIAPFAPLGRQPVGQENADLRMTSFKPLEQLAPTAPGENRRSPDERPAEVDEQERLRQGRTQVVDDGQQRQREEAQKRQQEVERDAIRELAARDREVRAHEQAHAAVGGQYASAPTYEYVRGPDGVSYAVGGEVSISTSAIPGDPEATILKAQQIRRAANAPAEPSPQDRRVAAEATRMEVQARAELQMQDAMERQQRSEQAEQERAAKQEAESERRAEEEARQSERKNEESSEKRGPDLEDSRNRNIDVTRRLIDIGVIPRLPTVGALLSQRA